MEALPNLLPLLIVQWFSYITTRTLLIHYILIEFLNISETIIC